MNKLNVLLLVLVLLSALAAVTVQNQSRQYFVELDQAQKGEALLNDDFSRLKLQQAKLSNHQLIQQAAQAQRLRPPEIAETHMVSVE